MVKDRFFLKNTLYLVVLVQVLRIGGRLPNAGTNSLCTHTNTETSMEFMNECLYPSLQFLGFTYIQTSVAGCWYLSLPERTVVVEQQPKLSFCSTLLSCGASNNTSSQLLFIREFHLHSVLLEYCRLVIIQ